MKILNELKIFNFFPRRLQKEVEAIQDFQTGEGVSKEVLDILIDKLSRNESLSIKNLKRLFYNSNLLNKNETKILGLQIKSALTPDTYNSFFEYFFDNYSPEQGFIVIKYSGVEQFLMFLNPIMLDGIKSYINFDDLVLKSMEMSSDFESFISVFNVAEKFKYSNGFPKVIQAASKQMPFILKYQNNVKSIITELKQIESVALKLEIIDDIFKTYITMYEDWAGGLLDDENFLNIFLSFIASSNYEVTPHYYHINKVLNIFRQVLAVIDEMTKLEPKRGRYWKNKGKIYSDIITKYLSNDLLAIAFIIKDYAFVEFARSGNAIYVYSKDDFINKIQHRSDWKDRKLTVKDIFDVGSSGTLTHTVHGDWMNKLDDIFRRL